LPRCNAILQNAPKQVSFSYWSGSERHHTRMPGHFLLTVILGSMLPLLPVGFVHLERASTALEECVGKKRVATVPTRAKKEQPRKRCRVIAPILM
jgi:hypothetical protein